MRVLYQSVTTLVYCRRFPYGCSGPATACVCPLASMLGVVPDIMEMPPPGSWSAVSGCNKELRQLVHSKTKTIFIDCASDIDSVIRSEWPKLSLIILCGLTLDSCAWLPDAGVQLLLAVHLSERLLGHAHPCSRTTPLDATALIVRSKSQHGLQRSACDDNDDTLSLL